MTLKKCPGCGMTHRMQSNFCSVCGEELVEFALPTCGNCGAEDVTGNYCTKCGFKLK